MKMELFDAINWPYIWLAALAGILFGGYVYYKGDQESSWLDIFCWGY